jgi:hypothetical protein
MPLATPLTTDDVRLMLAAELHKSDDVNGTADPAQLASFWKPVVVRATAKAERWLRQTLRARFKPELIAVWPAFNDYQMDLALYWCGVYGDSELNELQRASLKALDCRAEVTALTTLGGVAETTVGKSSAGELRAGTFARPFVGRGGLPAGPFAAEN